MNRRVPQLLFLAALVLALIVGSYLAFGVRERAGQAQVANPVPAATALPPLTAEQARALSGDLTSGVEARVRGALAISPEQPLDPAAVRGLAGLTGLTVDAATFRDTGEGTAQVTATQQGKKWTMTLRSTNGRWAVGSTEAVS